MCRVEAKKREGAMKMAVGVKLDVVNECRQMIHRTGNVYLPLNTAYRLRRGIEESSNCENRRLQSLGINEYLREIDRRQK